jgi:hypothetical protein
MIRGETEKEHKLRGETRMMTRQEGDATNVPAEDVATKTYEQHLDELKQLEARGAFKCRR